MEKKRYSVWRKQNKGSVTVEASLSLTFFVFFMVGIIGLINVCRVQATISNALHMAALDISHMSYFFEITGLYELSVDVQNSGGEAGEVLEEHARSVDTVLAGTETLLGTIGGGLDTIESAELTPTGIQEAMDELNAAVANGEQQAADLAASADALVEDLRGIAQDPIGFAKIMVQFGIGEGVGSAQNLIAGIFAESLIRDHIEAGGVISDANAYLEKMGVVDGLNGIHFMASSIFAGDDHTDINLIALYEVKLFPFLGDTFTVQFAQSASTRAWLSGDIETTTELPEVAEEEADAEEPEEEEPEEEESVWESGISPRSTALREIFHAEHEITGTYVKLSSTSKYYGFEESTNTLYAGVSRDIYAPTYRNNDGTLKPDSLNWKGHLLERFENPGTVKPDGGGAYELPAGENINFEYVIQIPENSSDEDLAVLQADVDAWMTENGTLLPESVASLNIKIVKVGGNSPDGLATE